MTYAEWLKQVENILMQWKEGAITQREAFNAIVGRAYDVVQTDNDPELRDIEQA